MIKRLINFVKRKKKLTQNMIENSNYLYPGEYIFEEMLRFVYLKDELNHLKACEVFGKPHISFIRKVILKTLKRVVFNRSIVIENNEDRVIEGTVCYMGIANWDYMKYFDFTNKKVLTKYFSEMEFKKAIENYKYFNRIFTLPQIESYNKTKLTIIEELIDTKSSELWTNDDYRFVINDIFCRYIEYLKICREKGQYSFITPTYLISCITEGNRLLDKIKNNIFIDLLNKEFPIMKLHGDLWTPNILMEKSDNPNLYYIDFEYSRDFIVFYDFFWFITEQAIFKKNYALVDKYFFGEYDEYFDNIFKEFDMEFETKYRFDYLNIFFLNKYTERWISLNDKSKTSRYNEYCELLDHIESLNFN